MIRVRLLVASVAALLLIGCTTTPETPAEPQPEVVKSPNDSREYRYLVLDNNLQVLLVSDPETDKSAASLAAFRGSMHDPAAHPGLAHFLEHMLFIGTAKYPEVDGYQEFISKNGGGSNAYTAPDHTNYFFDIAPPQFPEALDRFAQFFISPLFSAEYVEREKNAVNSEYQLQIKDDAWRGNAVERVAMNPDHPNSRFNIGSLDTLSGEVRSAMLQFFEEHYSADQMAMVALHNKPLDEIETLVRARFAEVPNRNLGSAHPDKDVYTQAQLPATLTFKPMTEQRSVSYRFPTDSTLPYYKSKPEVYLTNLLGHEGKGSLLQALKAEGWVNALYAGAGHLDNDESAIEVSMTLTEAGAQNIDRVTGYLFAYIDLLKRSQPERWRFDEQAKVADLGFQFLEKRGAMATVYQLAPGMMHLPPEDLLRAQFYMKDFAPDAIEHFADQLSPQNVIMHVQLPNAETTDNETWFDVPYHLAQGPVAVTRPSPEALQALHLPEQNPFLPENLALYPSEPEAAAVIAEPTAEVWQHVDTSFGAPKAILRFNLHVDGGLTEPQDVAAARLYQRLVMDALNEFAYQTYLGGISHSINALPAGFRFQVSGYNDKQMALLDRVLDVFKNLDIDEQRFDIIKAELIEALDNAKGERPFNQAYDALQDAVLSSNWPPEVIARAVEPISREQLTQWRDAHLVNMKLFALVHGNVPTDQAAALKALVQKHIKLAPVARNVGDVLTVDAASNIALDIDHNDTAYVAYIQDADDAWRTRAESALAVQLLRQAYFTSLRTEQQLGYVVAMTNRVIRSRGGVAFIVQSPVASADGVYRATLEFLAQQAEQFADLPEAAFEASRQGLLVRLRQADENLADRTGRYWADLVEEVRTLDSAERIASEVEQLTKADIARVISSLPERLAKESLIIYSPGQFEPLETHGKRYEGVIAFKEAAATGS